MSAISGKTAQVGRFEMRPVKLQGEDIPAAYSHPEYLAFMAGIRANPADDTPRLLLADWLDEHASTVKRCSGTHRHAGTMGMNHGVWHDGDPTYPHHHCDAKCWVSDGLKERAELIRVQCELARPEAIGIAHCKALCAIPLRDPTEPDGYETERIALRKRETELLAPGSPRAWFDVPNWWSEWNGLPEQKNYGTLRWKPMDKVYDAIDMIAIEAFVRRGFVDLIVVNPHAWFRHADTILAHHPLTRVNFTIAPRLQVRTGSYNHTFDFWFAGREKWIVRVTQEQIVKSRLSLDQFRPTKVIKLLEAQWPGITFHVPTE